MILSLQDRNTIVTDNLKIKTVHQYYSKLHREEKVSLGKLDECLKKQNLPKIKEKQEQLMNGPITIREVCEPIKSREHIWNR